jgi:uncharacterized tellurite resistance protein B-like protein
MNQALNQESWLEQSADKSITVEQLDGLMKDFSEARVEYEAAKELSTAKYHVLEDKERALVTALEQAGKKKYQVDGIGAVHFSDKLVYPTPKTVEQKEAFFKFIETEYGVEYLKEKLSIHHQTLQSICKTATDEAQEKGIAEFTIPGLERPTSQRSLNFRKEKST